MEKPICCAECGCEIEEECYFSVLDNYLQVKYFDSKENNIFCSKECLCDALSVGEVDKETGEVYGF